MEISKLSCIACGAPISVPGDLDYITCDSCSTSLVIRRGDGYVALKLAEKIGRSIEDSGRQTQEAIKQSSMSTQNELRRLQLQYELSTAEMKLANIQGEIRSLQRSGKNPLQEIQGMRLFEYQAHEQIRSISKKINSLISQTIKNEINALSLQLKFIKNSKNALMLANPVDKRVKQEMEKICDEENTINAKLFNYKKVLIVAQLSSTKKDISSLDAKEVSANLDIINNDILLVENIPGTPEQKSVLKDLENKQEIFYQKWMEFEKERVRNLLVTKHIPDVKILSFDGAQTMLSDVDNDIRTLTDEKNTSVVPYFMVRLRGYEKALSKRISHFNKKKARADAKAKRVVFFAGISTVITTFFLGLFGESSRNSDTNRNQEEKKQAQLSDQDEELTASVNQVQEQSIQGSHDEKKLLVSNQDKLLEKDVDISSFKLQEIQSAHKPESKRFRKGIFIIFLGILVSVGVMITVLVIPIVSMPLFFSNILDPESHSWALGIIFLPITNSFILGSLIFYVIVAPAARFSILGVNIPIRGENSRISKTIIKIFAALTILIGGLLVSMNIAMFFPSGSLFIMVSICGGSMLTILVAILSFVLIKDLKIDETPSIDIISKQDEEKSQSDKKAEV